MTFDAYETYCQWCKDHHRPAPSRAWWERACCIANNQRASSEIVRSLRLDQAEIDRERREGWARG